MIIKSKLILGALAVTALVAVSSCTSAADKVIKAEQDVIDANAALDKANQEYLEDIAEYREATADDITYNDSLIVSLKSKSKVSGKNSDPYYDEEIAKLEKRNAEMKKKMDDYEGDGPDNWTKFKEEFATDMQELGSSIRDLAKK